MAASTRLGNTVTVPADGDDYSYFPRETSAPLIPPQFVSPGQHQAMVEEIERQQRAITALVRAVSELTQRHDALEQVVEELQSAQRGDGE